MDRIFGKASDFPHWRLTMICLGSLLGLLSAVLFLGRDPKPIHIGFIGNLTGPYSEWGLASRDGALIAMEIANTTGGIKGRPIRLLIRNDQADPKRASFLVSELAKAGAIAIIGPTISATALGAVQVANREKILLMGTTTTTAALSGIDDFFFRVISTNAQFGRRMADYVYRAHHWRRVSTTFAIQNRAFTKTTVKGFADRFESLGGAVQQAPPIASESDYAGVARQLAATRPDGIFMVAGTIDTAAICQELWRMNSPTRVATVGLDMEVALQYGGPSVEGLMVATSRFGHEEGIKHTRFAEQYTKRFGSDPKNSAVYGYDAANVILEALRRVDHYKAEAIKEAISEISHFDSPIGTFRITAHGDVERNIYVLQVEDGRFVMAR